MDNPSPRIVWHASRADIARPTIEGRTEGDNHANSGLGIYCATQPESYIAGFGAFIHALTLKDEARAMRMTLGELIALSGLRGGEQHDRAWFHQEGRRLGQQFDVIELVESCGSVDQVIVLNDAAIVASRAMSSDAFLEEVQQAQATPGRRSGL